MSQTYQCQLKDSVSRTVRIGDTIKHTLSLTEILPLDEMKQIFREILQDAGFSQDDQDRWSLSEGGDETVVDLEAMSVVTTREEQKTLTQDVAATGRAYRPSLARQVARDNLKHQKERAATRLEQEAGRLQQQLSQEMASADVERREILHLLLQQVYAESLKRKARQMGDVMEISEGTRPDGEYELIIKVET
ncbi:MAG: hypothetical protein AAFV53_04720 [Myxococcota bacterium]